MDNNLKNWSISDKLYDEEEIYELIKDIIKSKNLLQSDVALPYSKKMHIGQFRKGPGNVPYIYHPLGMVYHALNLGMYDDELIAAMLLHDVCEDCNVDVYELPVNEEVKRIVELVTYKKDDNESKEDAKRRYYKKIDTHVKAILVKAFDRCNNLSTMVNGFKKEKIVSYIDETEEYIYPLMEHLYREYPEYKGVIFILKYHMMSITESIKKMILDNKYS